MTTLLWLAVPFGAALAADAPEIPLEKYELENGLDVILARDTSTPVVYVQVWYQVGSRDERPGLTGFAHLFEHLLFQGTQNAPGDYFKPLQEIGADVNGSTSLDRTEYHERLPSQHLPLALFMESDRMGWFLPALDQAMLDNQREVVRNERRQSYENEPYGEVIIDLYAAVFPEGHPYEHPTIGSHEDLEAATLDAVREFFATWYAPNNASLVISGDFDPVLAKELVQKYFGPIPRGPDAPKVEVPAASIAESQDIRQYDEVPEQRVWIAWISPALFAPGDADLDLLSTVLAHGKDSRLYTALVRDQQIAKEVDAAQYSAELGSMYLISATAAKGHTTDEVVAGIDEILGEVLGASPPTADEVEAAKAGYEVGFYGALRTVSGKGSTLSTYNARTGDPGYLAQDLARYQQATPESVLSWGQTVLKQPRVVLHVWPNADAPARPEETP